MFATDSYSPFGGCSESLANVRLSTVLIGLFFFAVSPNILAQTGPISISEWARETIELPPGFAPDMPSGVEELRFPPGWRDPDSDNFWSYAIVMRIDEPTPTTARLEELTDIYYTGLMSAFGVGGSPESPANEVDVAFEQAADHQHRGTMRLVDGFATFKPILINIQVNTRANSDTESIVELRASPQPEDHEIWSDLQAAIDHIHAEQLNQHLAPLAHLPQGEWRTTPANGTQQRDIWTWGPSKHALTSVTSNSKATSQSTFGSFRVIYHHPQRDELAVLALSAPKLIQAGTLTPLEDHNLRFDMTLFYDTDRISWATEPTRRIASVWTFDTPTSYTNNWIEDQGQPVDPSVTDWAYTKHDDISPLPASATEPPEHIRHLDAFLPFLESEWTTDTTRTTFAWIPYNEAIFMRTIDTRTNKTIAETIFYPHPHTKIIHTLTIHGSGAIDEGTASIDDNTIVIHAKRADHITTTHIEQRIEHPSAETIRVQAWSIMATERKRLADTHTMPQPTDYRIRLRSLFGSPL